jgi:hypothetical protein
MSLNLPIFMVSSMMKMKLRLHGRWTLSTSLLKKRRMPKVLTTTTLINILPEISGKCVKSDIKRSRPLKLIDFLRTLESNATSQK